MKAKTFLCRYRSLLWLFATALTLSACGRVIHEERAALTPQAVITVQNTQDSGLHSLREAIEIATPGSEILFAPELAGQTIMLTSGRLLIGKELTITGPDEGITIDGSINEPSGIGIITVLDLGGELTLDNLTLRGGNSDEAGGAIENRGVLTIINSTISGNSAREFGGGIDNFRGSVTIINSTISGNSAREFGGGILNDDGVLTIINSTISSNSAESGGGVRNAGDGTVTITNSTIVENSASEGGGVFNSGASANLANTIVANNPSGGDCAGDSIASSGPNLDSDGSCGFDLTEVDPLLGPLQDNGGPTLTHALLLGSPAIDAGNTGAAPDTDQRGVARPQGAAADIGAYEFATVALSIDARGDVDPNTGAATVSGTMTCSGPVDVDLLVKASQEQKQRRVDITVEASENLTLFCDGDASWSATLTPDNAAYRNGQATITAEALNSDVPSQVVETIRLFWANK